MFRTLLISLLGGFLTATASAAVTSGPVVNPSNGNSYYLLEPTTWSASQAEAVSLGGNLVTINDADENAWVWQQFGPGSLWTGFNDMQNEGDFVWVSGEDVTYTNWENGEPNNTQRAGGEDFANIQLSLSGRWNDVNNEGSNLGITGPISGVVEVQGVPEPSAAVLLTIGSVCACTRRRRRPTVR